MLHRVRAGLLLAVLGLALVAPAEASVFSDPLDPVQRAYVEAHGPFIVALGPTGAPFGFEAPDGSIQGITPDLLRLMEVDLGIQFEMFLMSDFAQGPHELEMGTIDVYGPTVQTEAHEDVAAFTDPLAWSRFGFWVGPGTPDARTPADLAGQTVAVANSAALQAYLADFPDLDVVVVKDMRSAAQMVLSGDAAAAFGGYANMGYYTATPMFSSLRPLAQPTHLAENVFAVPVTDPILKDILNTGLARLGQEQRTAVYLKWTGIDMGPPVTASRDGASAAWWVVGAAVGALAVLLASSAILRRQVRARTADLAAEHAKLERIMETSPGGLAVVEPDGSLAYANRRAEELLGLERDDADPDRYLEPAWQIMDLDGNPFPPDALPVPTVLRSAEPVHDIRYAIEWEDGRRIPLSVNAAPLMDSHGRVAAVVAAFEDLTAQLRMQEAERTEFLRRIEMQRLQEIDRFRREFINAAAHEMKNPLTPLSVQLHLLERDLRSLAPAHRQSVVILRRNLDRLARLVADMLDVTRLEAGRLPLQIGRLDLADLAEEAVSSLGAVAAQQGISLGIEADEVDVEGDGERLSQVLYNLIGNAIKYTPESGSVVVVVRQDAGQAIVEVQDTGLGLTTAQMDVLFEPFSRVHDAEVPGTGLGLHISRGIAEAHGGTLTCQSRGPGRGSTFCLRLPLAATASEGRPLVLAGA